MKVKGHATHQDVATGVVAAIDKLGNDAADRLARIGAALHAVDAETVTRAKVRQAIGRDVQLMVDIAQARSKAGATNVGDDDDAHTESGMDGKKPKYARVLTKRELFKCRESKTGTATPEYARL